MLSELSSEYSVRPARLDDVEAVCALCNAWSKRMHGFASHDPNEERVDWQVPGFDLETDTRVVCDACGSPIAFASVWDVTSPHVSIGSYYRVHPDHDDPRLEEALLDWLKSRARRAVKRAPADARVIVRHYAFDRDDRRRRLLLHRGYRRVRQYVRLRIEMSGPPLPAEIPQGIEIRPFDPKADLHATILSVRETFRDHWGHIERDLEEDTRMWTHWVEEDRDFDPSVWHLACDGNEIVGVSLGTTKRPESDNLAYIYTLGVRRAWRGRGIAHALLRHSFAAFYERGRSVVDLDADAENLTGAMRLYEGVGMHVVWRNNEYEKELRSGIDLALRSLEKEEEHAR